jgi:hypothetical protein
MYPNVVGKPEATQVDEKSGVSDSCSSAANQTVIRQDRKLFPSVCGEWIRERGPGFVRPEIYS